jgi:hypothetical protein
MSRPELPTLSRCGGRGPTRVPPGWSGVGGDHPWRVGRGRGRGWWTGRVTEKVTPDKAVEAMSKFGGTMLKTSPSEEGEKDLQDALHGTSAA